MKSQLKEHETWGIRDASKLQTYMTCPRKYFFEYILGWRSAYPNVHLEFGTAWHLAMEVLLEKGHGLEAQKEAAKAFESHYRQHFDYTWDESNAPKNLFNAVRAIPLYCRKWSEDNYEVLHIEVAGSVAVSEDRVVHFKTDTICRGEEGVFSLEHKTGSSFSDSWQAGWKQKMQVGVYSHVLYSLFEPNEVWGVKINGFFPRNAPRTKKDGTPYAGARDIEFHRVPVRRNLDHMNGWLWEVNHWCDLIDKDEEALAEASADDPVMEAFPKNTENCTKYGLCPFHNVCTSWNNPLQHSEEVPEGFKTEYWDPRGLDYVREVMEI